MKQFFKKILFFILFTGFGCATKTEEPVARPPGILTEEVFTKVLVEYALAESAANLNILNVSVQRIDSTYAFDPLKENNISKTTYDSTLRFYAQNPALYKKVYENVLAALSEMQTKRDTLKKDSTSK